MALNKQFKVKNDFNTGGRILSAGVDIADIFAASNTAFTLSATNSTALVAGGNTASFLGGNGVDVRLISSTKTVVASGINATSSTRGVASFSTDNFSVTDGAVIIKDGGINNDELAGSINDTKLLQLSSAGKVANTATTATTSNDANTIVSRGASGEFSSGSITAAGALSASGNVTGNIINAATGIRINNGAGTTNQVLKSTGTNFVPGNVAASEITSGQPLTTFNDTNVLLTLGGTPNTSLLQSVSLSAGWLGQLPIVRGGTGASTQQGAINALAGDLTSGRFLRGNGTNVVMSAIQVNDVPTLNQNTTGSAATLTTSRTLWGQSFNGSANVSGSLSGVGDITGSGAITIQAGGTNQDISLTPSGTGEVNISKVDIDSGTIDNVSIGSATAATIVNVDDLRLDGDVLSSLNAKNISLQPATGTTTATGNLSASGTVTGNIVNATTGFKINNGNAIAGSFLRGNGSNFVANTIQAEDVPTLNQNTTGSAATLTTTRTLWGQNFNGSANVTGNLTDVGNIIGSGAVTLSAAHNNNLNLVATGTGNVVIDKADINGGTIDGVSIGSSSVATYLKVDNVAVDTNKITFDGHGTINHSGIGFIAINGENTGSEARLTGPTGADLIIGTHLMDFNRARITLDEAINGNITFATNGTGNVVIDRADINGGAIDGTPIGATTASTGRFTSIAATGNVNIDGSLFVAGSAITINATDIITKDPLIFLAQGNAGDAVDIGFAAQYTIASPVPTRFTGLIRDTATGKWNLFSGLSSSPLSSTNVVFTGDTTIVKDTLVANLEGNVTGNAETATKLATGRIISLTGDVSGSVSAFDGSGNVTGTVTISNSAVNSDKILNGAVIDSKIALNTIGLNKLKSISNFTILGKKNIGDVSEQVCTQAGFDLLDDASVDAQRTTLGLGASDVVTFGGVDFTNGSRTVFRRVYSGSNTGTTQTLSLFPDVSGNTAKINLQIKQGTGASAKRCALETLFTRVSGSTTTALWDGTVYAIVDPWSIFQEIDLTVSPTTSAVQLVLNYIGSANYTATASVELISD